MKTIPSYYFLTFTLMSLTLLGCEVSTARLTDAKVCTTLTDNLCAEDMPVISADAAELVASCKLKNAPPETEVTFTWIYYGENKIEIDAVTLNSGNEGSSMDLHSTLSRPHNGWPAGVYEVAMKILSGDKEPVIKQFSIQ